MKKPSPPQRTKRAQVPHPSRRPSGTPQKPRGPKPGPAREEGPQRIAKLLARAGIASRRDIERMIEEGRIALDGKTLDTPATLLENLTGVTVDGKPVRPPEAARMFLFYKPQSTLTACPEQPDAPAAGTGPVAGPLESPTPLENLSTLETPAPQQQEGGQHG